MGLIEDAYLRHCLKHTVSCDLPGRLRLTFPSISCCQRRRFRTFIM